MKSARCVRFSFYLFLSVHEIFENFAIWWVRTWIFIHSCLYTYCLGYWCLVHMIHFSIITSNSSTLHSHHVENYNNIAKHNTHQHCNLLNITVLWDYLMELEHWIRYLLSQLPNPMPLDLKTIYNGNVLMILFYVTVRLWGDNIKIPQPSLRSSHRVGDFDSRLISIHPLLDSYAICAADLNPSYLIRWDCRMGSEHMIRYLLRNSLIICIWMYCHTVTVFFEKSFYTAIFYYLTFFLWWCRC